MAETDEAEDGHRIEADGAPRTSSTSCIAG